MKYRNYVSPGNANGSDFLPDWFDEAWNQNGFCKFDIRDLEKGLFPGAT
jgi:hypothetical protein